jgi:hypothetical protein
LKMLSECHNRERSGVEACACSFGNMHSHLHTAKLASDKTQYKTGWSGVY